MTYGDLETRIQQWALTRPDICAVLVVGSRAREVNPADNLSDLDLILLTTDANLYLTDSSWLGTFGSVLLAASDPIDKGIEWVAVYEGVIKADFTIFSAQPDRGNLADQLDNFPFQSTLERGIRILIDKFPKSQPLNLASRAFQMPSANRFEQIISNFWIVATRVAKFIQRGDLWRAVTMLYCKLRFYLVTMMEWHAHVLHGLDYDTWYDGRFMDKWLDADILASLPDLFGHYNAVELRTALHNMLNLFRRLAQVVAGNLGYDYPQSADNEISAWLQTLSVG
jgi:aminoglycoside 6-adenylyltransferase